MSEYGAFYWQPGQITKLIKESSDDEVPQFQIPDYDHLIENSKKMA